MTEAFKNLIILYCMDAPDWARYAAVDEDRSLCIYSVDPIIEMNESEGCSMWALPEEFEEKCRDYDWDRVKFKMNIPENINWKDTLIEL